MNLDAKTAKLICLSVSLVFLVISRLLTSSIQDFT